MTRPPLLAAWAAAVVCAAGCGPHEPPRPAESEHLPRLEIVTPSRLTLQRRIELSASVEAMERAELCARVPGVVEYLPPDVDIGRRVSAGEALVRLAVPDLQAQKKHKEALLRQARKAKSLADEARAVAAQEVQEAEAQEKRYAADYDFAHFQHDRITSLVAKGAQQQERAQETKKQMETAEAAWDAARAQIATRKAKLKQSEADLEVAASKIDVAEDEVNTLAVMIGLATVTAPFDGVISKRWVDRGATVKDPAAPLLTVVRLDRVRVLMDVPERDVPLVSATTQRPNADGKGDPVTLRVPALAERGEFKGEVTRLADTLDPNTRTMRTEMHLDNREGLLRPGMTGTAVILLEERYDVLTIPATALVRRGGKMEVFHVVGAAGDPPAGVVERAEVELGLDDGRRVEVRAGLTGTELVIAKGNGVVRAGERVLVVPARD